jgi:hypothetical protein
MAKPQDWLFTCSCGAEYKVVRVEGTPESDDQELTCISCEAALRAYEEGLALKYILVSPHRRKSA